MRTYQECLVCFENQAKEAARIAGARDDIRARIVEEVDKYLPGICMDLTPPQIAKMVYGIVEEHTGHSNVYEEIKKKSNKVALALYPKVKTLVRESKDPLMTAVRMAVAGNVIDYGISHSFDIDTEIEDCIKKDFFIFDYDKFKKEVESAKNILYILDNAGEIVFDKILIEEMPPKVVCAVRDKPIINDVTMQDARDVGLDMITKVISSGSDIPGTVIEECTDEFKEYFDKADLVISKGQGNFETLSDQKRPIFFIFKAKCPVVARHIGCTLGDIILSRSHN